MRALSIAENQFVSGGQSDTHFIVDPVAAVQTFLLLISVTDQDGFLYGSVVTGMAGGSAYGGWVGYSAGAAAGGFAAGLGGAVAGAGAGMILGGVACKLASNFAVGVYNYLV